MSRRCFVCSEDNPNVLESHHVVPRRHGGSDDPKNIVCLCANCHRALERLYDKRFYEKLDLLDANGVPDVEWEATSSADVVSSFAEVCLEYQQQASVRRVVVRKAFNQYLVEKGHERWDFDRHGTVAKFGRLLKSVVPDDVVQTSKQGERADKNLTLTQVGKSYYESQRSD